MVKETINIKINHDLYLQALDKLDMGLSDFVEYSLTIYLSSDRNDEYARLFRKACKLSNELDNIKRRLNKLSENTETEDYSICMDTVNRIHNSLGYIGRNQLRKIAKNYNVSPLGLIEYVSGLDGFDVRNFGDAPK